MSTPTTHNQTDFHAGKTDAARELAAGATLDQLKTRLDWLIDHTTGPRLAYMLGYAAQIVSEVIQYELTVGAETELAYADQTRGSS